MFKELFVESYRGVKGVKGNDVIVTYPKDGKLYGVFTDRAITDAENADWEVFDDFDIATVVDFIDDALEFGGWDADKKFVSDLNKWVKKFGVQKDFISFTPDSKNQTYMKFESIAENVSQQDLDKDAISSIARLTGARTQAIETFAKKNAVNLTKMYKAVATKKLKPIDLVTAIIGFDQKTVDEVIKKIERIKDV